MKTTQTRQWFYLLTFTAAGIAIFGLMHTAAVLFLPPAKDVRDYYAGVVAFTEQSIPGYTPLKVPPPGELYKDFFALKTNEPIVIDHYRVIYRGLESKGRFTLDIANTQLDAERFYPHRFESAKISAGIRIGNQRFRVLSARDTILHLQRIRR